MRFLLSSKGEVDYKSFKHFVIAYCIFFVELLFAFALGILVVLAKGFVGEFTSAMTGTLLIVVTIVCALLLLLSLVCGKIVCTKRLNTINKSTPAANFCLLGLFIIPFAIGLLCKE